MNDFIFLHESLRVLFLVCLLVVPHDAAVLQVLGAVVAHERVMLPSRATVLADDTLSVERVVPADACRIALDNKLRVANRTKVATVDMAATEERSEIDKTDDRNHRKRTRCRGRPSHPCQRDAGCTCTHR